MLTVVTGPAGSGKSTYVQEHKRANDIVIDMDLIAVAIGSSVTHNHSPAITLVAQYMRAAGIKVAIDHAIKGARVWIIDCSPSMQRWQQYRRASPRIIRLGATSDELRRRIGNRNG